MDDPTQVTPRDSDGSRGPRPDGGPRPGSPRPGGPRPGGGLRLGPVRITATLVMLVLAVVGSLAFLAYALTVRESTQIPLLAAGLAVLGIVFGALAVSGAVATYQAGSAGRSIRAMGLAILGGIASIISLLCFAGAILGAMLSR